MFKIIFGFFVLEMRSQIITFQVNIRKSLNLSISMTKQKTMKAKVRSLKIAKYDPNWQIVWVKYWPFAR